MSTHKLLILLNISYWVGLFSLILALLNSNMSYIDNISICKMISVDRNPVYAYLSIWLPILMMTCCSIFYKFADPKTHKLVSRIAYLLVLSVLPLTLIQYTPDSAAGEFHVAISRLLFTAIVSLVVYLSFQSNNYKKFIPYVVVVLVGVLIVFLSLKEIDIVKLMWLGESFIVWGGLFWLQKYLKEEYAHV
jgi:hypothetical protein